MVRRPDLSAAGAATLVALDAAGLDGPARLLASAFALAVAAWTAVEMVQDLLAGHWGVHVAARPSRTTRRAGPRGACPRS